MSCGPIHPQHCACPRCLPPGASAPLSIIERLLLTAAALTFGACAIEALRQFAILLSDQL